MNDEGEAEETRAKAKVEYERVYLQLLDRVGEIQREQAREDDRNAPFQATNYGVGGVAESIAAPPQQSGSSLSQIHADLLTISGQLRNAGLL